MGFCRRLALPSVFISTRNSSGVRESYAVYCMWCEENAQAPVRSRSFSDFLMENQKKYNLEHNNLVTNAAGRRVWGFMGIEALVSPNINGIMADSLRTYVQD